MTEDRLVAIISGLTLRGFREYKKFWAPDFNEELMLEKEKQPYLNYGSYPVAALKNGDGKTVGHVGKEYSYHIKRLIQLKNDCKAVVKDVKPISRCGEEILCDYVIEGKNTQDTRLVLFQFLSDISSENLKFYKADMKVKLENNWLSGKELQEALKPPAVKTSNENIPDEVGVDPETRQLYEKAIREGVEVDKSVRIMLIGCYNQGKTTLHKRLLGEPFSTVESTDGIDVIKFTSVKSGHWLRQDSFTHESTSARLAAVVKTGFCSQHSVSSTSTTILSAPGSSHQSNDLYLEEENNSYPQQETNVNFEDVVPRKKIKMEELTDSGINMSFNNNSEVDQSLLDKKDKIDEKEAMKIKPEHVSSFWKELKKTGESEEGKHCMSSIWDFGGQFIYYATHQLFHSRKAIYILVFNMSLALDDVVVDEDFPGKAQQKTMKDYLIFWMNSIHSFVGSSDGKEPVVILVGTHLDKLKGGLQEADDYFSAVRDLFSESDIRHHIYAKDFPLSLIDSKEEMIEDLRSTIKVIVEKRETEVAIHVPARWICLEQELQRHKTRNIITFKDLKNINDDVVFPIPREDMLKLFLKVKHAQGVYFYFDDGDLAEYVVLNPEFIISAFKCIIKAKKFCQKEETELVPLWKELSDNAVLKPELMHAVWKNASEELFKSRDVLTLVLKKHRIISEVQKYEPDISENNQRPQGFYIVPSLLKKSDKGKVVGYLEGKRMSTVALVYVIKCTRIAEAIFHRMLAAAIGTWPVLGFRTYQMVFNNAGIFEIDLDHAGLLKLTGEQIEILVIARCLENGIVSGIGDFFRRFVEEVINQEFAKLKKEDPESHAIQSYQIMIRCYHSEHKCEGSSHIYTKDKVYKHEKERVPCPDNLNHSLEKKVIDNDWFKQTPTQDEFPKRQLTSKEYSLLSTEIGFGWELLGIRLGLEQAQIDHINMDYQGSPKRIYEMLLKWDRIFDEEATFDVLVKVMRDLGAHLTVNWDKVYNLRDNFPKLL